MGVDIIGWRRCPLQMRFGIDAFLKQLKLRFYKQAAEQRVPNNKLIGLKIRVHITDQNEQIITYEQLCKEVSAFAHGIPECKTCPISAGESLGCYHYITYPLDSDFERHVFEFFRYQINDANSPSRFIFDEVISELPAEGTAWHIERGMADGGIAEIPVPLIHEWRIDDTNYRVDSAQILQALFIDLKDLDELLIYRDFWLQFYGFLGREIHQGILEGTLAEVPLIAEFYRSMVDRFDEERSIIVEP